VAHQLYDAGLITIVALVSPYADDRAQAKALFPKGDFAEVWVKTSPELCAERDPKGLYKKAAAGELPNFTGVGQEYQMPESADLVIDGAGLVDEIVELMIGKFFS
jgi:bifunctional enzyme CysN/CysC